MGILMTYSVFLFKVKNVQKPYFNSEICIQKVFDIYAYLKNNKTNTCVPTIKLN